MKSKHKSKIRSPRKRLSGKPSTSILSKKSMLTTACRDEVIWKLYGKCRKAKHGENIKIYLQNVDFPVPINYRVDSLNDLKRKGIIKNYRLETEERTLPPVVIEETLEPYIGLLPFISSKDFRKASKRYSTVDRPEISYVAIVECNPQTVLKRLSKNFEAVNEKRKEIIKREEIEDFFKKEQVLKCNELRFGLESGNVIYEETLTNFKTGSDERKLLEALMKRPNKRLNYDEINNILNPNANKGKRDISFIVRNIKQKLEITGLKKKNKDLIRADNGYMMVCE